jgi:cyclophilin family peptidyl-prolyl cis-trans isomerase
VRRLLALLCLAPALALALAACGGDETSTTTTTVTVDASTTTEAATTTTEASTGAVGCVEVKAPKPAPRPVTGDYEFLEPSQVHLVTMTTNCGTFTIRLDPLQSPNATSSFVWLVKLAYYDHTIFHRIVPNSLIQGGDPTATGSGGPGYTTQDTPAEDTRYIHGVVAMARTEDEPPGTAAGQFFIVTTTEVPLPSEYAVIGRVEEGLDVVDAIGELGDADEKPTQVVEIQSATYTDS